MDTKAFRFSVSSVKSYLNCGLKFKYEKIDKIQGAAESSHYRWLGKLVHTSIYQSIARFNSDEGEIKRWDIVREKPEVKDALAFFRKGWEGQPAEDDEDTYMKSLYPFEIGVKPVGKFWPNKNLSILNLNPQTQQDDLERGWKGVAAEMVKSGVDIVSRIHKIVQLEREIEFYIDERLFKGFIDVLAEDKDGKVEFYDFKTSWRKPAQKDIDKDLQFILYSVALKELLGLDYYPKGYLVHLKSGSLVEFQMTEEILKKAKTVLNRVFVNLEKNVFFDDFGGFLCAYCDFKHLCYGEDKKP